MTAERARTKTKQVPDPLNEWPDRPLLLWSGADWHDLPTWPEFQGTYVDPVVVTGADKEQALQKPPFPTIWKKAEEIISQASRVVIIGFSLSDRDSLARDLLRAGIGSGGGKNVVVVQRSASGAERTRDLLGVTRGFKHVAGVQTFDPDS
jgi:hypothetical protein